MHRRSTRQPGLIAAEKRVSAVGRQRIGGPKFSVWLSLLLATFLWSNPPAFAQARALPQPERPDEVAGLPSPYRSWEPQEQWVWDQLLAGKAADFDERYGTSLNPHKKAQDDEDMYRTRRIRGEFLDYVVNDPTGSSVASRRGLKIVGAWFPSRVDLSNIRFANSLSLENSRFSDGLTLSGAKIEGSLTLNKSFIAENLDASILVVDKNMGLNEVVLNMGEATFFGLRVGGTLTMEGIRITGALQMGGTEISESFFLRHNAHIGGEVRLTEVRIGDRLDFLRTRFDNNIDMAGLSVGTIFFLNETVIKGYVSFLGGKVEGSMEIDGSKIYGNVNMGGVTIRESLYIRPRDCCPPIFREDLLLIGADIVDDLHLKRATVFGNLDLSGLTVGRSLTLDDNSDLHRKVVMSDVAVNGTMFINNTIHRGVLELSGLTYKRLGNDASFTTDTGSGGPSGDRWRVGWIEWLALDPTYRPQPYQQLANVFRTEGRYDDSNAVLRASRNREAMETQGAHRWWLIMLWALIGYGIGAWYFLALGWALLLTIIGMIVLRRSAPEQKVGNSEAGSSEAIQDSPNQRWGWCFWASFDEVLPLVTLSQEHGQYIDTQAGHGVRTYFFVHRILGYILGLFIAAGFAGLTQGT